MKREYCKIHPCGDKIRLGDSQKYRHHKRGIKGLKKFRLRTKSNNKYTGWWTGDRGNSRLICKSTKNWKGDGFVAEVGKSTLRKGEKANTRGKKRGVRESKLFREKGRWT